MLFELASRVNWRMQPRTQAVWIGVGVLATRIPFIGHGYGEDPDAWRAILAAQHLIDTGEYLPSRGSGYPLPEYTDAAMLAVGLGSSWWIGLLTAIVSGVAAALLFWLFRPLGTGRAIAGAAAFAFTPEAFLASVSALDFMWGVTFFLAATVCVTRNKLWWMGVFLGLAVASRLTYALAIIPLALLYVDYDLRRLPRNWRLLPPFLVAAIVSAAFYIPAFLTKGVRIFEVADGGSMLRIPFETLKLFGVIGLIGVAAAVASTVIGRRSAPPGGLDRWALTVIALWGVLFIRLPHDAAYLIPALVGGYWLLCRYAHFVALWVMTAALLTSCFVLRIEASGHTVRFHLAGPIIWNIQAQNEIACVARAIEGAETDDYFIASDMTPQLVVQLGEPLAGHILYAVHLGEDGLVDTEDEAIPSGARVWVVDRVAADQDHGAFRPLVLTTGC